MILLSSIMVINHLVIHLKETKDVIEYLQRMVQDDPNRGLWVISLAAFLTSPFLTNDGVCLLFVEPILNAFEHAPFAAEITDLDEMNNEKTLTLRKEDAMYFLLALACSANIGSALTYTGNPQNMIVASDSLDVLPSYKFLLYMIPASLFSWVVSKCLLDCVSACWNNNVANFSLMMPILYLQRCCILSAAGSTPALCMCLYLCRGAVATPSSRFSGPSTRAEPPMCARAPGPHRSTVLTVDRAAAVHALMHHPFRSTSLRSQTLQSREKGLQKPMHHPQPHLRRAHATLAPLLQPQHRSLPAYLYRSAALGMERTNSPAPQRIQCFPHSARAAAKLSSVPRTRNASLE